MLEIVEGEALTSSGCRPVSCVRLRALSTRVAGQRGLLWRENTILCWVEMPPGRSRREARSDLVICALETLAECLSMTRLETRTKESNMYASRWVEHP